MQGNSLLNWTTDSKKGGEQPYSSSSTATPPKYRGGVDQLSQSVGDMALNSAKDDGWEVYTKNNRSKSGNVAAGKPRGSPNSSAKGWDNFDVQKASFQSSGSFKGQSNARMALSVESKVSACRGSARNPSWSGGLENNHNSSPNALPPPLEHGWNWTAKGPWNQATEDTQGKRVNGPSSSHLDADHAKFGEADDEDNGSDVVDCSDDDILSDDFDSDESQKSHETRKKNKWFKDFFEILDGLTVEQISEPARQWHCPACKGGPGAIDWYRGLQPLMTHAKTKGAQRVKLHRELAELLDEELQRRGTSVAPSGEVFGKWKGLNVAERDKEIVWPPMVIIMNTILEKSDDDKWTGMGNQELLNYFGSYAAVKARHSYGPQGHRGISVLIFEASAIGYLEAERLSKHFEDQGTDRDAWIRRRVLFYPGGKRQLYGYMAEKQDMDFFNQHSPGKSKLKFEMCSYQEMVVDQMKQMSEDNQQLIWFKNRVAREQRHSKALEESFGVVSEKLRKTMEENRIVRQRSVLHHEENKQEMDVLEQFFNDQIKIIYEAREAKEDDFEKIQQEQRDKVAQSFSDASVIEDPQARAEKIEKFIKLQNREMNQFVEERERLLKIHEDKKIEMKRRHYDEEVELENELDAELNRLMEKYTPSC